MNENELEEKIVSPRDCGPIQKYPNFHASMIIIFSFTMLYSVLCLWLLFDGWINNFSSIYWIWSIDVNIGILPVYKLALLSLIGAILGCGALDLISFHKYVAVRKVYDLDHIWGFFISPVLAAMIGLIVFALFQGGLLIFTGSLSNDSVPVTAEFGFAAVGFISGYNWYDAINKFRDISEGLFKSNQKQKSLSERTHNKPITGQSTEKITSHEDNDKKQTKEETTG